LVDRQEEALAFLQGLDVISEATPENGAIIASYSGEPGEHYSVLEALSSSGYKVKSFSEAEVDLEDVFMRVTRGAVQ
jgi:ABC-2 type transport system ATP-binding protein